MVSGRPASKRFRYVDICQGQSSASLCDLKVDNLRVDCCLLMSKSRWGQLHNQESGVMYLDLTFHQPAGCKLSEATITMEFFGVDSTDNEAGSSGLEVTEYFGPRMLTGERRECRGYRNTTFNPRIGTPIGLTAEAVSISRSSEVIHASRWKFTGTRLAAETTKSSSQTRRSRCRQLVWHLEENKLEKQAAQQPTVHSALAFHHNSQPFFLDIRVEAKMHRWRDRFKQSIVFPPRNRKSYTRSLIEPSKKLEDGESFRDTVLNLEQTMVDMNLHPVPEVSRSNNGCSGDSNTNCENPNEYALQYPPSKALSALVGGILGHTMPVPLPVPVEYSRSVHSDSSCDATLVVSAGNFDTTMQNESRGASPLQGDIKDASMDDANTAGNPSLHTIGKDSHPIYSGHELLCLIYALVYFHLSQYLATLVTYLIVGLNGLHATLERTSPHKSDA